MTKRPTVQHTPERSSDLWAPFRALTSARIGLARSGASLATGPLLAATLPRLAGWRIAPLVIVRHGRVAIGDAVAQALGARAVAVLIGERPGLSAPDSLGAYLTWRPGPRTTDAERNCISNIRPAGIAPADAAPRLAHLLATMRARGVSGVGLKDETEERVIGEG